MNISSTPFIRNDYWPDYNDINQLNQRIDDVENEISLVNIHLSTDIENVSNNLNSYAKEQADTSITNNIIVNNLNANYAEGKFANFDNTFTNNAYVENLTVNKPVFDITLNTPHLENTTSLDGNFYKPNIIDAKLSGDVSGDLNVVNVNQLNAVNANISNLYVNTSPKPVQSSAVLGYDSEGRVIPVHATYDVGFPENADYLWTDQAGTAFVGVKATEVGEVENLITAYGVKNAIDALNTEVTDNFNLVTNALNDIDQWQNSFENSVANSFNDVANNFNGVNNALNDVANNFNDVNNVLNAVGNTFNEVNTNIENTVSTLNNRLNDVESSIKTIDDFMFNDIYIPEYGSFNSSSPVNYQSATTVELYGNAQGGTAIPGGGGLIKFNTTTKTVTFGFSGACRSIRNANGMFTYCNYLDQNILIPNTVEDASYMFADCSILNQNILIPNSVKDVSSMFFNCVNLDQNILVPSSVKDVSSMFDECASLNQNILVPNSVENTNRMFYRCYCLDQNILIPNSVKVTSGMFIMCSNLNQNILIPNSVENASFMFAQCYNLNQNILIPSSVAACDGIFAACTNLNQNILIPNSVKDVSYMFDGCASLNQNILIPNSVTNTYRMFNNCVNLNQDIYIYFQNVNISGSGTSMDNMFFNTKVNLHNVHIPSSVPKDTSNNLYNCLVNGKTGLVFAAENIINDLPVDPVVWPPIG